MLLALQLAKVLKLYGYGRGVKLELFWGLSSKNIM
jgi:hypothetical protein